MILLETFYNLMEKKNNMEKRTFLQRLDHAVASFLSKPKFSHLEVLGFYCFGIGLEGHKKYFYMGITFIVIGMFLTGIYNNKDSNDTKHYEKNKNRSNH